MATVVQIPDGARYVLIVCVPAGEKTQAEARFDETQMDIVTALELTEIGKADLAQKAGALLRQTAQVRLTQPLPPPPPTDAGGAPDVTSIAKARGKRSVAADEVTDTSAQPDVSDAIQHVGE